MPPADQASGHEDIGVKEGWRGGGVAPGQRYCIRCHRVTRPLSLEVPLSVLVPFINDGGVCACCLRQGVEHSNSTAIFSVVFFLSNLHGNARL